MGYSAASGRRLLSAITIILIVGCAGLGAESGLITTVGAYTETETNNAPWAGGNLTVAPGLNFGLKGKETPVYGWLIFENRQQAEYSVDGYTGQELRTKFKFGSNLNFGETAFNPEYELRFKAYVDIPVSDFSTYENRFHLNFNIPLGGGWSVYLKAMPTLIVSIDNTLDDTGGDKVFLDYYQEIELGTGWSWNQYNSLILGIYNELSIDEKVRNSSGAVNNGGDYRMYEFQARIVYRHRFRNGIQLDPFARLGIVRNFVYEKTAGDVTTADFRRDRFGVNVRYAAQNGLAPYLETYYQRSNMGSGPVQHRFDMKVGLNYVF